MRHATIFVMKITDASHLTDAELAEELGRLAGDERQATVALIIRLAEFDARRLYEPAGFHSLFAYCRTMLHLSEDAIFNRIETARAARRFPEIVDMLADGRLSPTTVRMLAPRLTESNHQQLLAEAAGLGKRDVEELRARHFPQPDVAPSIRKMPDRLAGQSNAQGVSLFDASGSNGSTGPADVRVDVTSTAGVSIAPTLASDRRRHIVRPLAPGRFEIRFTADAETRALLQQARDLLGHAVPSGDLAQIFGRALKLLVAELRKKKFGATSRPRPARPRSPRSSNKPMHARREVSVRDGERCAFVSADGRRCEARRCVEFHHVEPESVGGETTPDNLSLRCRAHNGHEVDLFFGPGKRYGRPGSPWVPSRPAPPRHVPRPRMGPNPGDSILPDWARTPPTGSRSRSGTT